jgi:nucleotide-binding universal stress UspA family protein
VTGASSSIVVGYDGSPDAERALDWAAAAATRRPGTAVHLTQALALPPLPFGPSEHTVAELLATHEQEARHRLDAASGRLATLGVPAEIHLRRWLPAETILEHAAKIGAGLIAVGQHGHGPTRVLLGSVSGKVARAARTPVLVARGAAGSASPRRILLALDGSPSSLAAAAAVARWASTAAVDAVTVDDGSFRPDPAALHAALERVGLDPARTELRLESGPAASTLLDLAAAGGFDLVAAGRRGLSAWRDLLTGGVSEKLLLLSPCPILLAHA